MGRRSIVLRGAALAMLAGLAGCGGGDGDSGGTPTPSPAPAPSPTPTPAPTPTPSAFTPVAAQLFTDPLYNTSLAVLGNGWVTVVSPGVTPTPFQTVNEDDNLSASYNATSKAVVINGGIAGSGTVFQIGQASADGSLPSVIAQDAEEAAASPHELFVFPATGSSPYRYISVASLFTTGTPNASGMAQLFYGAFGVAQPTKTAEVPATGVQRYNGTLFGSFDRDAGATGLEAALTLDFNYAGGGTTGSFVTKLWCMMGCSAPDVTYTLGAATKTGPNAFAGEITTAGTATKGTYTALLAGPNAAEVLLAVEFPYYNNQYNAWLTYGGVFLAKKP